MCSGCFLDFGNNEAVVLEDGERFLFSVTVVVLVFILFENLLFDYSQPPHPTDPPSSPRPAESDLYLCITPKFDIPLSHGWICGTKDHK